MSSCLLMQCAHAAAPVKIAIGMTGGEVAPKELGLNYFYLLHEWKESTPGIYRWTGLKDDPFLTQLKALKQSGVKVAVTLTHVHMDQKHVPDDLRDKRFNDPALLKRWQKFLQEFLARYGDHIDLLNIGNEVNTYFGAHKPEWQDYAEFFKISSAHVHAARPKLKVGIPLGNDHFEEFWKDIALFSDYLAFNYYTPCSSLYKSPTAPALDSKSTLYFAKRFDEVLKLSGNKLVLLSEIGCATHPDVDSSPELQAEFVRKLFAWLRGKESKIIAACWVSLKDWPYEGTKIALKGYLDERLLKHEPFMRYLTSLGLQYEDGKPKPGYNAFKGELARYRGY
jgi:hypothetical protein